MFLFLDFSFKFWIYITTYLMSLLSNPFQTLTSEYGVWKKPESQCSLPASLLYNLLLFSPHKLNHWNNLLAGLSASDVDVVSPLSTQAFVTSCRFMFLSLPWLFIIVRIKSKLNFCTVSPPLILPT